MGRRRKSRREPGPGGRITGFLGDRLAVWVLGVLVVGVPLLVIPRMEDAFRFPKLLAAQFLALLSIALLALRERRRERSGWSREPAVRIALLLLVPAALSGLGTDHPEHFRAALLSLTIALAAFVAWARWLRAEEVRRLLDWQLLPAIVLSTGVALQRFGVILFDFEAGTRERLTWTSWAGGPFDLSAWLLVPALWFQVRLLEGRGRQGLLGLGLVVVVAAIAITQTISTLVALGLASLWVWRGKVPLPRAALAIAVVVGALLVVGPARERIVMKAGDLREGRWNDLLTGRLDGWRTAVRMAGSAPVLGVGHGAYRAEFGPARAELAREGVRFHRRQTKPYFVNAHSEPFEVLAEWGVVGLLGLALAVGLFVRRGRAGPVPEPLRRIFWPAALALGLVSVANFPWRLALVAYPALLLFAGALGSREPDADVDASEASEKDRDPGWAPLVVALVVVAMAAVNARWAWRQVEAQTVLYGARSLVEAGAAAPRPFAERALDLLETAGDVMEWDVRFEAARGDLFLILGRPHAAVRAYRTALEVEPRPEIQANLGLALRELDRNEEAMELFQEAVLVDPSLRRRLRRIVPDLPRGDRAERPARPGRKGQRGAGSRVFTDGFEAGSVGEWSEDPEDVGAEGP